VKEKSLEDHHQLSDSSNKLNEVSLILNLGVCIMLRVLDQVQGFPSNAIPDPEVSLTVTILIGWADTYYNVGDECSRSGEIFPLTSATILQSVN
jgi:hypothetical protein